MSLLLKNPSPLRSPFANGWELGAVTVITTLLALGVAAVSLVVVSSFQRAGTIRLLFVVFWRVLMERVAEPALPLAVYLRVPRRALPGVAPAVTSVMDVERAKT